MSTNSHSKYSLWFLASVTLAVIAVGLTVHHNWAVADPPNVNSQSAPQTLLFVQTTPAGAEVRLDGKVLGKSDGLFPVQPGTYKVVIDLSGHPPREQQITVQKDRITRIELVFDKTPSDQAKQPSRPVAPRVVATNPPAGATEVDPELQSITVVFDRDMSGGFSFTGGGPDYPEIPEGKGPVWQDRRTCVLPVRLQAAHYYRVGINSKSHQNFRSADGIPTPPSAIYFTTRGASEELKNRVRIPHIVSLVPANGATDVDPSLNEIRVEFDMPMGPGFSWTGGGPRFPEIPQGKAPTWSEDGKTCILPVRLKPESDYMLGLNSVSHKNFQSKWGVPLEPVPYRFSTRTKTAAKTPPDKLTETQRLFYDWDLETFPGFREAKQLESLSPPERAADEERWLKQLASENPGERIEAIDALVALGSKKAIPGILQIAAERKEKDNADRHIACRALGLLGDSSVVPELVHLTYHYNFNTRFNAQISLAQLTGQNFGRDVAAWKQWWEQQGGKPPISEQAVSWASSPETLLYADPKKQEEFDREFLEEIQRRRR